MIDTTVLDKLFNDKEMVRQFLLSLTVELPKSLSSVKSSFEQGEFTEMSIHAHTMKTQFAYLNKENGVQCAQAIENYEELQSHVLAEKLKELEKITLQINLDLKAHLD
jgi:HPt (histidine-containing phosphotransfer) domain-containing protein